MWLILFKKKKKEIQDVSSGENRLSVEVWVPCCLSATQNKPLYL